MMRATVQAMLVARHSILKINLVSQAALGEQFERSIDGRVPDARILVLDQSMKVLRAQMVACVEENLEDPIPPGTLLQAVFAQIPFEDAFGHPQTIVAGDRRIVNAFLECFLQASPWHDYRF